MPVAAPFQRGNDIRSDKPGAAGYDDHESALNR
jgi:hypothetical protein